MPVFKVEVVRKVELRSFVNVRADSEGEAEEKAAKYAAEHVADDDMDEASNVDEVTCLRRLEDGEYGDFGRVPIG